MEKFRLTTAPDGSRYRVFRDPDELDEWGIERDGSRLALAFETRAEAEGYVTLRTAPAAVAPDGSRYRVFRDADQLDEWGIECDEAPLGIFFETLGEAEAYVVLRTAPAAVAPDGTQYRIFRDPNQVDEWGIECVDDLGGRVGRQDDKQDVFFETLADAETYIVLRTGPPVTAAEGVEYRLFKSPGPLGDWSVERNGVRQGTLFESRADAEADIDFRMAPPITAPDGAQYRIYRDPTEVEEWGIERNGVRQETSFKAREEAEEEIGLRTAAAVISSDGRQYRIYRDPDEDEEWGIECDGTRQEVFFGTRSEAEAYVSLRTAPPAIAPDGSEYRIYRDPDEDEGWGVECDGEPLSRGLGTLEEAMAFVRAETDPIAIELRRLSDEVAAERGHQRAQRTAIEPLLVGACVLSVIGALVGVWFWQTEASYAASHPGIDLAGALQWVGVDILAISLAVGAVALAVIRASRER